jgi:TDG/mug DNA glycosylase family protein
VGHHFARPGNRFWPALHLSGFTERRLSPFEDRKLLARGLEITNVVACATAAAELVPEEPKRGRRLLRAATSHNVCLIAAHNHFLMWYNS